MSAIAERAIEPITDDRLARRNALVLACAQALAGANTTVIVGSAGIIGIVLAPDRAYATVPVSTYVIGLWIGTLPVGAVAKRYGRLPAFEAGALCGMLAGLVCAAAVIFGSFALLCLGTAFGGLYAAAHQSYRFAAADTASEAFKPKAISFVLTGGVLAGIFGPQLIILTKDVLPQFLFAASYLAQAAVAILAGVVLTLVRFPAPPRAASASGGRPLAQIFRQPRLIAAVICAVASYAMMNLLMTSAPVAMIDCSHTVDDAALGLQWHVIAMYAPSFFAGALIASFGAGPMVGLGLALIGASGLAGLTGTSVAHFWAALILLGFGWNFSFIGATAMVTQCHRPEEHNKVQAVNDFLIFGSMAIGSFSSGQLLAKFGWPTVNVVVLAFVFAAALLSLLLAGAARKQAA
ncbi:MAG: MFS transporter [Rhodoplanes sp.]|jgi:predicted MFS family arabinose efflux permease